MRGEPEWGSTVGAWKPEGSLRALVLRGSRNQGPKKSARYILSLGPKVSSPHCFALFFYNPGIQAIRRRRLIPQKGVDAVCHTKILDGTRFSPSPLWPPTSIPFQQLPLPRLTPPHRRCVTTYIPVPHLPLQPCLSGQGTEPPQALVYFSAMKITIVLSHRTIISNRGHVCKVQTSVIISINTDYVRDHSFCQNILAGWALLQEPGCSSKQVKVPAPIRLTKLQSFNLLSNKCIICLQKALRAYTVLKKIQVSSYQNQCFKVRELSGMGHMGW